MPGTVIPVLPGTSPTQLSGASFEHDSTIFNNSEDYEVWISDKQSVGIGRGYRIGPLGSITWIGKGRPWAAVGGDLNGVIATVAIELTVSNDVKDPVNPVDVAIAVAKAGIPNTALTVPVWTANGILAPGASTPILDVRQYSTLIFTTATTAPAPFHVNTAIRVFQVVSPTVPTIVTTENFGSTDAFNMAFSMPLTAGGVYLTNSVHSDYPISLSAILTTRQQPRGFVANPGDNVGSTLFDRRDTVPPDPIGNGNAFGQPFVSNGSMATARIFLAGTAGESPVLGLQRLILANGTNDLVWAWHPFGPYLLPAGGGLQVNETFYVPPGMWRLSAASNLTNLFVDVQISMVGTN